MNIKDLTFADIVTLEGLNCGSIKYSKDLRVTTIGRWILYLKLNKKINIFNTKSCSTVNFVTSENIDNLICIGATIFEN